MEGNGLAAFLNSALFTVLVGAIAGALSATLFASRNEEQRRLLDEILACNVAIGQCISIINSFFNVKRQSIVPFHAKYELECVRVISALAVTLMGGQGAIAFCFDLHTMQQVWTPVEALNNIVANRILSGSRPSILAAALTQAIHNLQQSILRRNELVEQFKGQKTDYIMPRYFGYERPGGHLDTTYPDLVSGIIQYTDDCLYFGMLLSEILTKRGRSLAAQLGSMAPPINEADFAEMEQEGLMPDHSRYPGYERSFRPKEVEMVVTM